MCGFKRMGDKFLMVRLVLERFPDNHLWWRGVILSHVRNLVAWFHPFLGVELDIPDSVCVQAHTPEMSNCVPSLSSPRLMQAFCSCRAFVVSLYPCWGVRTVGSSWLDFFFFFPFTRSLLVCPFSLINRIIQCIIARISWDASAGHLNSEYLDKITS